jgi:hypothetical protein
MPICPQPCDNLISHIQNTYPIPCRLQSKATFRINGYAHLISNLPPKGNLYKKAPGLGLIAHMQEPK